MNGVHDMGGMQGMGPIRHEPQRADVPRALGGTRVCALARAANPRRSVEPRCVSPWHRGSAARRVPPDVVLRAMVRLDADDRGRRRRRHAGGDREWEPARPAHLERPCWSRRRRSPRWSTAALRRGATSLSLHDSSRDSACARETFIHQGTRDCRVTCEARAVSSFSIAACFSFPTQTRICAARNRSISTRCDSPRAKSGAIRRRRAIRFTWTCGTTTSSESDHMAAEPEPLAALPHLLRNEGGPVFAEPWQAQAFALAVKLSEQGHFTWKEWAAALAHELQAAANRGEPDDGSRYYEHWLAALERLVTAKGLAEPAALVLRKEAWTEAYRNTPHGRPVELPKAPGRAGLRSLLLGLASAAAAYWLIRATGQPFSGPQARFRRQCRPGHAARYAACARARSSRRAVDTVNRRAQRSESRMARGVLGDRSHADAAGGRHAPGGVAR